MNLADIEQLLADEEAVSPVIGVILMVAITVILAAVIGTFVLGLGDNVQTNPPNANFQFEYESGDVTIAHNGGENVDTDDIVVQAGGTTFDAASGDFDGSDWSDAANTGATISTGDSVTLTHGASSGDSVRVIWQSPSGGSSNTIGSSQIP